MKLKIQGTGRRTLFTTITLLLALALVSTSVLAAKGGNGGGGKPGGGDDEPAYTIFDLVPLQDGDYSEALAISDDGALVVGWSTIDASGAYLGAVWEWSGTAWTPSLLPTLGGDDSRAFGVSTAGPVVQIVGRAKNVAQYNQPVVWEEVSGNWVVAHTLPLLGSPAGNAQGINGAGQVVGTSQLPCSPNCQPQNAVLWEPDGMGGWNAPIPLADASSTSLARDINETGDRIVGVVDRRAWLWTLEDDAWVGHDLGTIDGEEASAYEINANDEVVGWSLAKRNAFWHGAMWQLTPAGDVSELVDLGTIKGRKNSRCYALNDAAEAVGESWMNMTASIWNATDGMSDLAGRIPSGSGWSSLDEAQGISNAGRVVGIGVSPSGETHGFLLEPITP